VYLHSITGEQPWVIKKVQCAEAIRVKVDENFRWQKLLSKKRQKTINAGG
jgi:hypothetical protein